MTIENANSIDRINCSRDEAIYTLVMIEDRAFGASAEQFNQLLEKINAYVSYIQTGQFHEDYPQAQGRQLQVRLLCWDEPQHGGDRLINLLRMATQLFAKHDVNFQVEIIPLDLVPPGRR